MTRNQAIIGAQFTAWNREFTIESISEFGVGTRRKSIYPDEPKDGETGFFEWDQLALHAEVST